MATRIGSLSEILGALAPNISQRRVLICGAVASDYLYYGSREGRVGRVFLGKEATPGDATTLVSGAQAAAAPRLPWLTQKTWAGGGLGRRGRRGSVWIEDPQLEGWWG